MKLTKVKFGLIILIFIVNLGAFVQINGIDSNTINQSESVDLISASNFLEVPTDNEVNEITYEPNNWELELSSRRTSSHIEFNTNVEKPSYSIVSVLYNTHPIIQIDGNADFLAYNFTGNGTFTDPYVISNWNITADFTHLILITNTDVYFEIRENYLNGINRSFNAVFLKNVTNGLIIDNIISNVEIGVYLEGAHGNDVVSNDIFDTLYDVSLPLF